MRRAITSSNAGSMGRRRPVAPHDTRRTETGSKRRLVTFSPIRHAEQLFIPRGFAHGFCALSDVVDFVYQCTDVYEPNDDHGVLWSDPGIAIQWPVANPSISAKDQELPPLNLARTDLPVYLQ